MTNEHEVSVAQGVPPPRIGVVATWIASAYWGAVMSAAIEGIRRNDAHAMVFCLGYEAPGAENIRSDERESFFELVNGRTLAGAVILSSASFSDEGIVFGAERGELPMVSIGRKIPGGPCLWVDNAAGIRRLMEHLMDRCGHRRIAFIRGTQGNAEAEARHRAYLEFCQERSEGVDPTLVANGSFTEASGERAAAQLLEQTGARLPDAIVAANDCMAVGALRKLRSLGLIVPKDIALAGFDDLESRHTDPPLTTVRQPLHEMGQQAARVIRDQMLGVSVAEECLFEPELVVRGSCGCRPQDITPSLPPQDASNVRLRETLFLMKTLREGVLPHLPVADGTRGRTESLIHGIEARLRVEADRCASWKHKLTPARERVLGRLAEELNRGLAGAALEAVLTDYSPWLATQGFYLVTWTGDIATTRARLSYACEEGQQLPTEESWQSYPARELLPRTVWVRSPPSTWLVLPLKAEERLIGAALTRDEEVDVLFHSRLVALLGPAVDRVLARKEWGA
jgi:LacI family transcriptional regulator